MMAQSDFENISNHSNLTTTSLSLLLPLSKRDHLLSSYYLIVVPVMIAVCFLAILGNLYILISSPWIRRSALTANLLLSLGLAAADAWAAFLVMMGLLVNSYLPFVHGVTLGRWAVCYFLIFEMIRLAGLVTSIFHLLALSLNHWFSIVSPLKYKTLVTPGSCRLIIVLLWLAPILIMFLIMISLSAGAQTWCDVEFYFHLPFRLIFISQIAVSLFIMLIIYALILRRLAMVGSCSACRGYGNLFLRKTSSRKSVKSIGSTGKADETMMRRSLVLKASTKKSPKSVRRPRSANARVMATNSRPPSIDESDQQQQQDDSSMRVNSRLSSKIKAVTTTLLILGTFAVGWLPAVVVFSLICTDCVINKDPPRQSLFTVGVVVNCLIIGKLLLNPLVYAFRILEIRYAIWRMHSSWFGLRSIPPQMETPERFRTLDSRRRMV